MIKFEQVDVTHGEVRKEIDITDLVTYHALPCRVSGMIYLNGEPFNENDFGTEDRGEVDENTDADVASWGCPNRTFKANAPSKKICDMYHLTEDEYKIIADYLESLLSIGECGWCI